MGCDIHLHQELKINGVWHHWGNPRVNRDYRLFEKMAGVRGDPINALSALRGLPADATEMTVFDCNRMKPDNHSVSWLGSELVTVLMEWIREGNTAIHPEVPLFHLEIGFLFGNYWTNRDREEWPPGMEDFRWVFWFR